MRSIAPRYARGSFAWLALAALVASGHGRADTLEVKVVDAHGRPVGRVAVYALPAGAVEAPAVSPTAVMDQQDNRFVPHLLVVQKGASVSFPNHDDVSHHVYSFSEAKSFELGLYKGQVYPPVVFDAPGIVVLGCNIHDGMLGYIAVVDTPYYALSDAHGLARIDVPSGDYTLEVWTPRLRPAELPAAQRLAVGAGVAAATFTLTGRLAPDHDHGTSSLSWDRY